MSALGQKRTLHIVLRMSALPPKADIETGRVMSALCQKQTHAAQQIPELAMDPAGLTIGDGCDLRFVPTTEVGRACPSGLRCSRVAHLGEEKFGLAVRYQGYPHYRCRYPHHG